MVENAFSQTENQRLLEQSIGRYLRESYDMPARAAIIESESGFGDGHWAFFAEMGLLGLPFSEEDGGFGGTLADVMLISRLFGEFLVVEPYHEAIIMAGRLLAAGTNPEQKSQWLSPVMSGDKLVALAHRERAGRQNDSVLNTTVVNKRDASLLRGAKCLVPVVSELDGLLVTAKDDTGNLVVCVLPLDLPGLSLRQYRGIDGHRYSDVQFDQVEIPPEGILALSDAEGSLDEVLAYGDACLCAEALGILESLQQATVEYARTRKQFGTPIGSFQALKHRMVDCFTTLYQARALVELLGSEAESGWRTHLAAAKAYIAEHGIQIGHEAIQIHGGMGVTDELAVSHYHKRLTAIRLLLGGGQFVENPVARQEGFLAGDTEAVSPAFETYLDKAVTAFRSDVREFVHNNLSDEVRKAVHRQVNAFTEPEITGAWLECLKQRGWQAPLWPEELGGTGWNPLERFVYEYETGLRDVPELVPMGFRYVGPVIANFGTDWQKSFFLPKILSGEHYWAQGFSEPQAGSDLVALKTTAVRDGEDYVINGTKMWTTHAHHANWLFCLARTEKSEKPHKGIGFFLIELNSPGIRIEAIPLMTGPREVNQVFLDDVRVPESHLVGDPTKGWEYTKFLLEFERGGAVFCGRARSELNRVKALVGEIRADLVDNPLFLDALARLETRLMALELLEFRHAAAMQGGGSPGTGGSITKLLASELRKDISELTMQITGYPGIEFQNQFLCEGAVPEGFSGVDAELVAVPRYLNMRAESIYGGSSEVQKEIIAKAMLGLR